MEIYNGTYCVYIHTNKINGKMYVGYTKYENDPDTGRWLGGKGYLSRKDNGRYQQPRFAHAINKYGWDNFEHEIVASHLTKIEAERFEKLLINQLKTMDGDFGYNLTSGGDGVCGRSLTDEDKQRQSRKMKQYFSDQNNRKKSMECARKKVIWQFSADGVFIKQYSSINEAGRQTNTSIGAICDCALRKIPSAGECIWCYENDADDIDQRVIIYKNTKQRREHIVQLNLNKIFVKEWDNALVASKATGINHGNICSVCTGKRKQAGGFLWLYLSDYYSECSFDNCLSNNVAI